MMHPKTHLILVSAQPIPNLTPILDDNLRPETVIMLVSQDMREQAAALETLYKKHFRIQVQTQNLPDPWNAQAISDQIDQLIKPYALDAIALNATGGTKLMSIAAYEAFYSAGRPVFYVHPERDCVLWLNSAQPEQALAHNLKLKDYLMAYGADSVTTQTYGVPDSVKQLTQALIHTDQYYGSALSILNALAAQAKNPDDDNQKPFIVKIENKQLRFQTLKKLIELFSQAQLCQLENENLSFPNENARFLVNGGWLEQHTYQVCRKLAKQLDIQDIACSINLTRLHQQKPVPNEIDLALLRENKLYLIECKTKRYSDQDSTHSQTADTLYKLNTLRTLYGGSQAKAMLLSFDKLNKTTRNRAKDLKINICSDTELKRLEQRLQKWLTGNS